MMEKPMEKNQMIKKQLWKRCKVKQLYPMQKTITLKTNEPTNNKNRKENVEHLTRS